MMKVRKIMELRTPIEHNFERVRAELEISIKDNTEVPVRGDSGDSDSTEEVGNEGTHLCSFKE